MPEIIKENLAEDISGIDIAEEVLYAADVFSGAGGLSVGAELAGIQIKFAVENDKHAAETFRYNHPDTQIVNQDIRRVNPTGYTDGEEVFIVFGGPPCQGFSTSNTKTRNDKNPNNFLFFEFLRFVRQLNPKWFLFENVEGITSYEGGKTVQTIKKLFDELGYQTTEAVLVASDYGVPQDRNRFIMVGNRLGLDFEFPQPIGDKISVWEAISDLPSLSNGDQIEAKEYSLPLEESSEYAQQMRNNSDIATQNLVSRNKDYVLERYRHIKPGQNWQAIPDELMKNYSNKNNCHSGIYKRLHPDRPSVVISNYRKNMLIHPFQDRGLSVREAARLQSFPDNFTFKGSLSHIQQQIGNAVPPKLAYAIFDQIIRQNNEREN